MWVKICANTNLPDAAQADESGADAVGFIFAASKRRVTAEQVAEITASLPEAIEKVGVFATTDATEIEHAATACGLTMVQLHSEYNAALVARLSHTFGGEIKIIQTVSRDVAAAPPTVASSMQRRGGEPDVTEPAATPAAAPDAKRSQDQQFLHTLRAAAADSGVWAVLLDASVAGVSGGLGVAFDWKHVAGLVDQALAGCATRPRLLLAGGLKPENVAEAIGVLKPFGVDVASGVEASPGRKDHERVGAFVHAARAAQ
jgi:phosphoribosylanthranilate isomerase